MQRIEHRFTAMGSPCRFRLDCLEAESAMAAVADAEAEVRRLEYKYSRYLGDSLTCTINRRAGSGTATPVDPETAGLLDYAQTLWEQSDGLFDLTSGVLRRAWDFRSGRLPEQSELDQLLPLVGWDHVRREGQSIYLPIAGMELDFGGCVKEYAADAALAELVRSGIRHVLVDLGGDMAAAGGQASGAPWPIGIRSPDGVSRAVACS